MEYIRFKKLIKTMEEADYDYKAGIRNIISMHEQRKSGIVFSLSLHVRTMIFSMLSDHRPWEPIAINERNIDRIFNNYDIDFLKGENPCNFERQIREIKCGNQNIKYQMESIKYNIEVLEKIERDFGSVDAYYNTTPIDEVIKSLSDYKSPYKLKRMGVALVCEYLKNMGLDIIKPDVHVCRLLARLGYSKNNPASLDEAIEICRKIANEYQISATMVDTVLWQYCAENRFEVCCSQPYCHTCGVDDCPSRK